jgi:hypothetical protein
MKISIARMIANLAARGRRLGGVLAQYTSTRFTNGSMAELRDISAVPDNNQVAAPEDHPQKTERGVMN